MKSAKEMFHMGSVTTASNTVSSILTLGIRYLMIAFGRLDELGVFAFSVDLAQRTVAIFISLATFAVVPRALRSGDSGNVRTLLKSLTKGWFAAVIIAAMSAVAIIALAATGRIEGLNQPVFHPISYAIIALATVIYRTGKMMLSPIAMRFRRTNSLLIPFFLIAPLTLLLVAIGLWWRIPFAPEIGYLIAFLSWSGAAYSLLIPKLLKEDASVTSSDKVRKECSGSGA
jgi:hypothetical protein